MYKLSSMSTLKMYSFITLFSKWGEKNEKCPCPSYSIIRYDVILITKSMPFLLKYPSKLIFNFFTVHKIKMHLQRDPWKSMSLWISLFGHFRRYLSKWELWFCWLYSGHQRTISKTQTKINSVHNTEKYFFANWILPFPPIFSVYVEAINYMSTSVCSHTVSETFLIDLL